MGTSEYSCVISQAAKECIFASRDIDSIISGTSEYRVILTATEYQAISKIACIHVVPGNGKCQETISFIDRNLVQWREGVVPNSNGCTFSSHTRKLEEQVTGGQIYLATQYRIILS